MTQDLHYSMGRADIIAALTAYRGITTADGAADGSTLIDFFLAGSNDFITNKVILIGSGNAIRENKGATSFVAASGTIGVVSPFSAQILRGTLFRVLNFSAGDIAVSILNALIAALLVLSETGGTHRTIDNAEHDIYINNAPAGVFEPQVVKIDFTNQLAASIVVVRTYYRYNALGAPVLEDEITYNGVQHPQSRRIPLDPNRFGIRVSMQRTAGADIDYDWEVLYRV